jgi:hypothetical protein
MVTAHKNDWLAWVATRTPPPDYLAQAVIGKNVYLPPSLATDPAPGNAMQAPQTIILFAMTRRGFFQMISERR